MIDDDHDTKVKDNALNDNFYKKEFQKLWKAINTRYAYLVDFESKELIEKTSAALNGNLYVAGLQYTLTEGIETGTDFDVSHTQTRNLDRDSGSAVKYDLRYFERAYFTLYCYPPNPGALYPFTRLLCVRYNTGTLSST
jgi:type III restriction enzyme